MSSVYDHISPKIGYVFKRRKIPWWLLRNNLLGYHDITLILRGTVTYHADGKDITALPGDIVYFPSGIYRKISIKPDEKMFSIVCLFHIDNANPNDSLPFPTILGKAAPNDLVQLFTQLANIFLDKNEAYTIEAQAYLLLIIAKMIKLSRNHLLTENGHVALALKYIEQNYHSKITSDDLSAVTNLHSAYIAKLFKKHLGKSFNDYLNEYRVKMAKEMMMTHKSSIKRISTMCGFSDPQYFSKVFKNKTGQSPTVYFNRTITF